MVVRIAVDAMGGDDAPDVVMEGASRVASDEVHIMLVGPIEVGGRTDHQAISHVPAPDVVGMDEAPSVALKGKPRSSIHVGIELVRNGDADAFVSAGNTGAVMAVAMHQLGRLPGVARPALPSPFPTTDGFAVVLDVGANVDCRPEHLLQFGRMGAIYSERVLGIERPRVGLLNVGEEPSKGNEAARNAHELLAADSRLAFVGNVEGRDLMLGAADVVVCDGFVGNILLKFGESMKTVLPALIRREVSRLDDAPQAGAAFLQQILGAVMKRFSYEEFGGMPLLGVGGNVVIGHGGSSARAIARMIETAAEMVRAEVPRVLANAFNTD